MNLHIAPDNVFINKFYENLRELGLAEANRIVIRTNEKKLKYVRHGHAFAPLYSSRFDRITGDTASYDKVFIHQFTPLLFRWVATQEFRRLSWMVWGADLYNLPFLRTALYEEQTLKGYVKGSFSLPDFLYRTKVRLLHQQWKDHAYAKVNEVLTWMKSEFEFAINHIDSLKAQHRFFFYENEVPYHALDQTGGKVTARETGRRPIYILGNSSTAELNHIDAVLLLQKQGIRADLHVPLSYGDVRYKAFLKRSLGFYTGGEIRFLERYMPFDEYVKFLSSADGLIMNNIRPQGYGNILIMMYLGKEVYLNDKNLSTSELDRAGLTWRPLTNLNVHDEPDWGRNKTVVRNHLSHELLLRTYGEIFT